MRSTEPLIVDPGPQLAVNLVHLTELDGQKSIWDLVFPRERGSRWCAATEVAVREAPR